jgi:hypothetical protein
MADDDRPSTFQLLSFGDISRVSIFPKVTVRLLAKLIRIIKVEPGSDHKLSHPKILTELLFLSIPQYQN